MSFFRSKTPSPPDAGARVPFRAKLPKYTIRFLALLGIALIVWKVIAVHVTEQSFDSAMRQLRDSTTQRISERTTLLARAAGEAAAIALYPAVRVGDVSTTRTIADLLQRRTGNSEYLVADARGMVVASSPGGPVGMPLDATLQRVAATLDQPVVDRIESGLTRVIVPIRSEPDRAGTLILTFRFH